MKYESTSLLDNLHKQTEQSISRAIREWQQLPADYLLAQPGPAQWSAAQCLEHLNSYGRYYLPAMEKAISTQQGSSLKPEFTSSWLGNYFYNMMLIDAKGKPKKQMSAPKDHRPHLQLDAAAVLNEFISQQEKLLQLLSKAHDIDIASARVPISIARFLKLSLGDTFLFFVAHNDRHMAQAERAILAAGHLAAPGNFMLA